MVYSKDNIDSRDGGVEPRGSQTGLALATADLRLIPSFCKTLHLRSLRPGTHTRCYQVQIYAYIYIYIYILFLLITDRHGLKKSTY